MTIFDKMTEMGYEFYNEEKHNDIFQKKAPGGIMVNLVFDYNNRTVCGCVYPSKLIYNDTDVHYINQGLMLLERDLQELEKYGITVERR